VGSTPSSGTIFPPYKYCLLQVVKVFDGTDWMDKDYQGNAAFNKNISKDGYTVVVKTGDGKDITINAGKDYPINLLNEDQERGVQRPES
jgi:hypothetical protein